MVQDHRHAASSCGPYTVGRGSDTVCRRIDLGDWIAAAATRVPDRDTATQRMRATPHQDCMRAGVVGERIITHALVHSQFQFVFTQAVFL